MKDKIRRVRSEIVAIGGRSLTPRERAKLEICNRALKSGRPLRLIRLEVTGYNGGNRFTAAALSILDEIGAPVEAD